VKSAQEGRAVVVVEHNLRFVRKVSTRTVVMESGRVEFAGETQSVFGTLKQLRPYLGPS
jgi:ABC-type histidine transport system ATPase subunit